MTHLRSHIETIPRDKGDSYEPVRLSDLVHQDSQWAWDVVSKKGKLHKFARHIRSSQTFALNLFGALPEKGIIEILSSFFGPVAEVDEVIFEFEDEEDRLQESIPRGQKTQVDVVLRGRTFDGRKVALLVEVKLSEVDFGSCSGAEDALNDAVHVCSQVGPFGSDPSQCYKLRNHGHNQRRLYDRYLNLSDIGDDSVFDGCWYRTSGYQPMRNVALAEMLRREEGIDTLVAVCAPLLHRSLWSHFYNVRRVLPRGSLVALPAELVASLHESDSFHYIANRYFFDVGCPDHRETDLEIATWQIVASLDEQFQHELRLFETHPGGGQYNCITLAEVINARPHARIDLNRSGRVHVHGSGGTLSLDDAWELALSGQCSDVARTIGEALGLVPRDDFEESPWRFFERTISLGRRAGETFQWRNSMSERSVFLETERFLPDWNLERHGDHYDREGVPRVVYEGRGSHSH